MVQNWPLIKEQFVVFYCFPMPILLQLESVYSSMQMLSFFNNNINNYIALSYRFGIFIFKGCVTYFLQHTVLHQHTLCDILMSAFNTCALK